MLLQNLLGKNPAEVFIYLERRMNNEDHYADVHERYSANGNSDGFSIPFVLLDIDEIVYFESDPDRSTMQKMHDGKKIRFFIHPEMIPLCRKRNIQRLLSDDGTIWVYPTSSTRTVFCMDGDVMIKTDLEKKIGDGVKKLNGQHIDHIRRVSMELKHNLPAQFAYMPEPIGAVYRSGNEEVGLIARQFNAEPKALGKKYVLQFFSLFSIDKNAKEDPLLLDQIIKSDNGSSVGKCVEKIIKPYLDSWALLLLQRGLRAEMHAQNTLLEIDGLGNPSRIVYRDLQDIFVDKRIRKSKGLDFDFKKNIIGQNEKAYYIGNKRIDCAERRSQISNSLTYDYRMGRALDYFLCSFDDDHLKDNFREAVKEIWKVHFNGTEIFPKMAYHLVPKQENLSNKLIFEEVKPRYR